MGFIIWSLCGLAFIIAGIYCIRSKKEVAFAFWANSNPPSIKQINIKPYNKALGKLWCGYGFFFILIGLPLLGDDNSIFMIIPLIGCVLGTIILMCVYIIKIEGKYREHK